MTSIFEILTKLEEPLKNLRIERVERLEQAQIMREIRNLGRAGFTSDGSEITPEQQNAFWEKNQDTMIAFVYYEHNTARPVAYAAVLLREGKYWSTNAVHPDFRGRGYGKAVLYHVVMACPRDVWAMALRTNTASIKEHNPAVWEVIDDPKEPLLLFHTWKGRPPVLRCARTDNPCFGCGEFKGDDPTKCPHAHLENGVCGRKGPV